MRKKLCALGLLALLFGAPVAADNLTDDQLLYKFAVYTRDVYLGDAMRNLDPNQLSPAMSAQIFTPRVLGYSLCNLLRYAPYGSENQRLWQRLVSRVRKTLFEIIDLQAAQERWGADDIVLRKQAASQQFDWGLEHMYDNVMAMATGVKPDQAPDFFASLTPPPPQPPIQQPPADPPPVPPIDPSDPPPPASDDAVPGVYKVVGQSWENDPNCGSEVKLTGDMNEVRAAFKLWDRTGVTWDYEGPAKWDGRSGTPGIRDLKGKTRWLTYPHIWRELTVRITLDSGGVWRASAINIGGNLFRLAESRTGRLVDNQPRILTVRNTTAAMVSVFLDLEEGGYPKNKLGDINPRSEGKLASVPQKGRWYLKIVPSPDTYPYMYTELMIIKETQNDYFFEVLEWHLKQR